jgi:3-hydroxyacyl-CoA dehydrogenase
MKLGVVTSRPHQVLGIHFFNPVPVLTLVELVPSLLTSEEVATKARNFVEDTLGVGDRQSRPCRLHRQRVARPVRAVRDPEHLEI